MTVIYIGGSLIGIATGFFFTANWALGTRIVPQAEAGRYLGISNLAGAGAGAVGAYIGGPIADYLTVRLPEVPGAGYVLLFAHLRRDVPGVGARAARRRCARRIRGGRGRRLAA